MFKVLLNLDCFCIVKAVLSTSHWKIVRWVEFVITEQIPNQFQLMGWLKPSHFYLLPALVSPHMLSSHQDCLYLSWWHHVSPKNSSFIRLFWWLIWEGFTQKNGFWWNFRSSADCVVSDTTVYSANVFSRPGFESGVGPDGMILRFLLCDKPKIGAIVLNFSLLDKWTDALSEDNLLPVPVPVILGGCLGAMLSLLSCFYQQFS